MTDSSATGGANDASVVVSGQAPTLAQRREAANAAFESCRALLVQRELEAGEAAAATDGARRKADKMQAFLADAQAAVDAATQTQVAALTDVDDARTKLAAATEALAGIDAEIAATLSAEGGV